MKKSWSIEYLEKKHGIAGSKEYMRDKIKRLKETTGVKWSYNNYHARYVIMPVVAKEDWAQPSTNASDIELMKSAYSSIAGIGGASISELKEALNWGWARVISTVVALVKSEGYYPNIDRQSNCCAIKKRR